MSEAPVRVAIIGAGISGLSCARTLAGLGLDVEVFDKGRGPGGRMSTRRVDALGHAAAFDHGAQYFTVRSPEMARAISEWQREGVVSEWSGAIVSIGEDGLPKPSHGTTRYVATPGMNAICHHLARGLRVRSGCRMTQVDRCAGGWELSVEGAEPLGPFDFVVSTAPPVQTASLLLSVAPDLAARVASVAMDPCWALMVAMPGRLDVDFDGAFINTGPLSWAARTSSKPGRGTAPERWVLHANARWSQAHLEEDPAAVVAPMLAAFFDAVGLTPIEPAWSAAHRWRYAIARNPLNDGALFDGELGLGACGDWANGNRVEGAWESGMRAARMVAAAIDRGG